MNKYSIAGVFLLLAVLTGCSPAWMPGSQTTEVTDAALAVEALSSLFGQLAAGGYQEAAAYYGGSYQTLQDVNHPIDREDQAALFQQACEINGFVCLPVKEIVSVREMAPGEYQISATLMTMSGEAFVLGPCCGTSAEEMPPQSTFEFHVVRDDSGEYKVMDLPVYVP